ncbi:MAG: HD domain-containing protein [Lachnospiraceae bacterium]|nr:HD domain-containing protein [Lachnospiraceae bacterium]
MTRETYTLLEDYMLSCMEDSAHDKEHIYRVLYTALDIAGTEKDVDMDVLICACLLHDIGRREQFEDPRVCHARAGADKAYRFLREHGFPESFAAHVRECISSHRYRKDSQPQTIEAKILFDADKVDVSGAIGIARTLVYKGQVSEPLYRVLPDGRVSDGTGDAEPSFFQEYKYKLEGLYDRFHTVRGAEIAGQRRQAAAAFYESLLREVSEPCGKGREMLRAYVE